MFLSWHVVFIEFYFPLCTQIKKNIARVLQIKCCQTLASPNSASIDPQSPHILDLVSCNNDNIANLMNNAVHTTSIFSTNTHVPDDILGPTSIDSPVLD